MKRTVAALLLSLSLMGCSQLPIRGGGSGGKEMAPAEAVREAASKSGASEVQGVRFNLTAGSDKASWARVTVTKDGHSEMYTTDSDTPTALNHVVAGKGMPADQYPADEAFAAASGVSCDGSLVVESYLTPTGKLWAEVLCDDKIKKQFFDGKPVPEISSVIDESETLFSEALAALGSHEFETIQFQEASEQLGTDPVVVFKARVSPDCTVELQRRAPVADLREGGLGLPLACSSSTSPTVDLSGVTGQQLAKAIASGATKAGGSPRTAEILPGRDGKPVIKVLSSKTLGMATVDLNGKPVQS